jgi:hypothetical protein
MNQTGVVSTGLRWQACKKRLFISIRQGSLRQGDRWRCAGRVAQGVAARFGVAQFVDQVREAGQVVGFVHHDKFLILQTKRIKKQLADVFVLFANADVLVHHALTRLAAHQIPFGRFGERINDQVRLVLIGERIDLLFGASLRILRWTRKAPERILLFDQVTIGSQRLCKFLKEDGGILIVFYR